MDCAIERMAPNIEKQEFEDQPAIIIPYTPILIRARINKLFKFQLNKFVLKGYTNHNDKIRVNINIGEIK